MDSIKRPLLVAMASGAVFVMITLAWVKSPALVPASILVLVGILGGVAFLVAEVTIVLRIARRLGHGSPLSRQANGVPPRALVGLSLAIITCNSILLSVYRFRPPKGYILAANLAVIVAWVGGQAVLSRKDRQSRRHDDEHREPRSRL